MLSDFHLLDLGIPEETHLQIVFNNSNCRNSNSSRRVIPPKIKFCPPDIIQFVGLIGGRAVFKIYSFRVYSSIHSS